MNFTFREITIILKSLFRIDYFMLGLRHKEESPHTDDELMARSKLTNCYQQYPHLRICVMNIVDKLKTKNPKKYGRNLQKER
jgi:hypothetical protein